MSSNPSAPDAGDDAVGATDASDPPETGDVEVTPDAATSASAVRDRLDGVTDPELDTSIVELDYVDTIRIDAVDTDADAPTGADADSGNASDDVFVGFTLPTAWCSPAFAWMMAGDAREAVESLPTVARAEIELRDHMHEQEITRGINEGLPFEEAFPDADGGVESVRLELDRKARTARQHDATGALLDAGLTRDQVAGLTRDDLDFADAPADRVRVWVRDGTVAVEADAAPVEHYLEKAEATGVLDDEHSELFRTPEAEPFDGDDVDLVRKRTRLAGVNMGGQGTVCDALNEARHAEDRPPLSTFSG
ncbi:iron-sulfur cluster assembly protein [Halobaculum sp. CBA1158]|uniref:iron-sulfur cluster assembly protein n=1 Tax=Halobaculum sp. CBA1158 TaxID=2904243 RepID=UPI001F3F7F83|nr:iron-sulfur cluster assembly protein [Halobaculum sp. CBA1158]UIP00697.1 iron-sulfur cluster assembly protein [Halobaculum sp. CBA1158]